MSVVRWLLLTLIFSPLVGVAADVVQTDFAALSDPVIAPIPPIDEYDERCLPLWRQALQRPEVDLQRKAAETVARAIEVGMPGVETLLPDVRLLFHRENLDPAARFAAARALIVLQDRESQEALFRHSQSGDQSLRQLVEPRLAEWNYEPIRAVWKERMTSGTVRRQDLLLALRGLGKAGDASATAPLLERVDAPEQSKEVRLIAAEAAGQTASTGLEAPAQQLVDRGGTLRQLCAVALLSRHDSTTATELLARLAHEPEPTVASKALARLRVISPERVLTLAEEAMRHKDANVRREGILAYLTWPTAERIRFVGRLLDDPHPGLRGKIRDEFVALAKQPELDPAIREISRSVLSASSWRGQEQAALVLATLDDKPSAPRLAELLPSPRDEVAVTVAWGLRKLAVPETLPAMLEQARKQTERRKQDTANAAIDAQVAHLFEAMGIMRYAPGESLMQEYLPLSTARGVLSRPSAAWALGKLYEGQSNPDLAEKLIARVIDPALEPPEYSEMRQMSAVSLTRINATQTVDRMKKWMGPTVFPTRESLVLRWAVMQLSQETLPIPAPARVKKGVWFLEPAREKQENP